MRMSITSLLLGSLLVLGFAAHAQTPQPEHQHQQTPANPSADMAAKCKAMMAEHEKMMAEMKAADQKLDELVSRMNSASGQAKVDATAAAVSEFVAQRKTMRDRMMQMHPGMMSHMMEHMQAGPQSTAMCPMMKMGAMKH